MYMYMYMYYIVPALSYMYMYMYMYIECTIYVLHFNVHNTCMYMYSTAKGQLNNHTRVILELHACDTRAVIRVFISLYVRGTNARTAARFQVVRSQG